MNKIKNPVPASELIPHRGTMLLIKELSEASENSAKSNLSIGKDCLFAGNNGEYEPVAFVEILAQLTAAYSGFARSGDGKKPVAGMLVGIRDFVISGKAHAGDALTLEVSKTEEIGQLAYFSGKVIKAGNAIAEGHLRIWTEEALSIKQGISTGKTCSNSSLFQSLPEAGKLNRAMRESTVNIRMAGDAIDSEFCFDDDFPGFDGHFPNAKILPGILLVKAALFSAETALAQNLELVEISNVKFSRPVLPGVPLSIAMTIKDSPERLLFKAKASSCGSPVASLSFAAKK